MGVSEWIMVALMIAMTAGVILRVNYLVRKKPAVFQSGIEQFPSNREAYSNFYRNIADGSADGFILAFSAPRAEDESTELSPKMLAEVYRLFKQCNEIDSSQYKDPEVMDMGFWGALPAVVVLVGHPIPLTEEKQIRAVKKLTSSWYACVEEVYKGARRGLVSIAYGEIQFLKPDFSCQRNFGVVMGSAFDHAVVTISDAYLMHKLLGATHIHKIAVDIEAANKLEMRLPGTALVSYEIPQCQMFLGEYSDNSHWA